MRPRVGRPNIGREMWAFTTRSRALHAFPQAAGAPAPTLMMEAAAKAGSQAQGARKVGRDLEACAHVAAAQLWTIRDSCAGGTRHHHHHGASHPSNVIAHRSAGSRAAGGTTSGPDEGVARMQRFKRTRWAWGLAFSCSHGHAAPRAKQQLLPTRSVSPHQPIPPACLLCLARLEVITVLLRAHAITAQPPAHAALSSSLPPPAHARTHAHSHTRMHACTHACACTRAHAHTHVRMHAHTRTSTSTKAHANTLMLTRSC